MIIHTLLGLEQEAQQALESLPHELAVQEEAAATALQAKLDKIEARKLAAIAQLTSQAHNLRDAAIARITAEYKQKGGAQANAFATNRHQWVSQLVGQVLHGGT